ncbi:hypothetical protein D3C76_1008520 [compost metagenome]
MGGVVLRIVSEVCPSHMDPVHPVGLLLIYRRVEVLLRLEPFAELFLKDQCFAGIQFRGKLPGISLLIQGLEVFHVLLAQRQVGAHTITGLVAHANACQFLRISVRSRLGPGLLGRPEGAEFQVVLIGLLDFVQRIQFSS